MEIGRKIRIEAAEWIFSFNQGLYEYSTAGRNQQDFRCSKGKPRTHSKTDINKDRRR